MCVIHENKAETSLAPAPTAMTAIMVKNAITVKADAALYFMPILCEKNDEAGFSITEKINAVINGDATGRQNFIAIYAVTAAHSQKAILTI
ncbi:hypothetical protein SDC9_78538 [bioreactor metagenome]|uniref:Uncharacterized protein n=1 Tax=bioreactor metagenome TaxID=1076179 RepID=A0A644YVV9_9ZZZZ